MHHSLGLLPAARRPLGLGSKQRRSPPLPPGPHVVLYIVRHGESTGNRDGVLQGQSDYPLTEIGRAQAAAVGRRLREEAEEALAEAAVSASSVATAADEDEDDGERMELASPDSDPSRRRGRRGPPGGQPGTPPPQQSQQQQQRSPPVLASSFFHRAYASDLSRARDTAEIVLAELNQPLAGKAAATAASATAAASTGSMEDDEAGAAGEGLALTIDPDLREILGGAREGRWLGTTVKEAVKLAAREQGVPLEAFVPPPHETLHDLHMRARRFIERALSDVQKEVPCLRPAPPLPVPPSPATPSSNSSLRRKISSGGSGGSGGGGFSLTLSSPFMAGKKRARARSRQAAEDAAAAVAAAEQQEDDQQEDEQEQEKDEEKGDGGEEQKDGGEAAEEEEAARPRLPVRVLVVSHGGLLLQMFQKVFGLHAVHRVLNASLTVVEARLPASPEARRSQNRLALIFASPHSSRRPPALPPAQPQPQPHQRLPARRPQGLLSSSASSSSLQEAGGRTEDEDEAQRPCPLADGASFRCLGVNDVAHLERLHIVTTRSTAL